MSIHLNDVWGFSDSNNLYAVGFSGTILHRSDGIWSYAEHGLTSKGLYDVWGSNAGDVYVVGEKGTAAALQRQRLGAASTMA